MSLHIEDLSVRYAARTALRAVHMHAAAGTLVGLIGPNGCGKTTLLRAVAGLLNAASGRIQLEGQDLRQLNAAQLARTLAYLPQGHLAHWPLRVDDLVRLGRLPHAGTRETAQDHAAVVSAMQACDVEKLRERRIDTLSGGERARVMLARAFAVQAPLLLADEPVASLDPQQQLRIMGVLRDYASTRTVVIALHELTLAARFCDQLVLLHDGVVRASGPPQQVLSPQALAEVYGVSALHGVHDEQAYIVPWQRL